MALPRFFDRVADAAIPLLGGLNRSVLASRLEGTAVRLEASKRVAEDAGLSEGYLLAANLLARLYPRILIEAPDELADRARALIHAINPEADLEGDAAVTLAFTPAAPKTAGVTVFASGWNVVVDGARQEERVRAAPPAALAAAAIGAGDLFRVVFADLLPRGRHEPEPESFNLVTLERWGDVPVPAAFDVGAVHLAGAGAVGEAAVETLRVTPVSGEIFAVDPEHVEESNLQRYVLAKDADVGAAKTALVGRALEGTSLSVTEVPTVWGADERSAPGREVVLVALDTADARISIQAGLHDRIYNAYTQPADLGWSRHERFGVEPCLACLYWPTGPRPHRHRLIAAAIRQPELRVRAYLASGVAVGDPMPAGLALPIVEAPPTPAELDRWMQTPLLDDIAVALGVQRKVLNEWAARPLEDLYRGICAGAIIRFPTESDGRDVLVPLAHQSAFAGVMLAVQLLVASDDALRARRPPEIEGRYDVMRKLPSSIAVPGARTPGCICDDADFIEVWAARDGRDQ